MAELSLLVLWASLVISSFAAARFNGLFQCEAMLIQGLAHNRTFDSSSLQTTQSSQIVERRDSARGNDFELALNGQPFRRFQIRPAQHSVLGNIGVHDSLHTASHQRLREGHGFQGSDLVPTMGCHSAVASVDSDNNAFAESLHHFRQEFRVLDSGCAHDDSGRARIQNLFHIFH
jgi:hypothetical protein